MSFTSPTNAQRLMCLSLTTRGRRSFDLRNQTVHEPDALLTQLSEQQNLEGVSQAAYCAELARLTALDAWFSTPFDGHWPLRRAGVGVLRILGTLPVGLRVAIIGARQADRYGLELSARIARRVVESGATVLSGGALGIDIAAHRAALEFGGHTIAVLGSGLSFPTPRRHLGVFQSIVLRGALVSPFPCVARAAPWTFLYRNPWLAALADVVIVVQASVRSGALHTARFALRCGTPVWVVPGTLDNPRHGGCHQLLHEGALALRHELDWCSNQGEQVCGAAPAEGRDVLSLAGPSLFSETWRMFDDRPRHLDDVLECTEDKIHGISAEVAQLELLGWLRRGAGGGLMQAWPQMEEGGTSSE